MLRQNALLFHVRCFLLSLFFFSLLCFFLLLLFAVDLLTFLSWFMAQRFNFAPIMTTNPPRSDASRSRSPLHGPAPYNPELSLGSIESSESFTRLRPVLVMVQFHDLAFVEEARNLGGLMHVCPERNVPNLHRHEEQAIFTYTKFLNTHQLNFTISGMETELLFQVEQTWGVTISPDNIKLTIPHREHHHTLLPADMTVREASDQFRPEWHREQDFGFEFRQLFCTQDHLMFFGLIVNAMLRIFLSVSLMTAHRLPTSVLEKVFSTGDPMLHTYVSFVHLSLVFFISVLLLVP